MFQDICIRLLDENGQEVPNGQAGEICFDNPFFRGYIGLPEETARVMRDGVFHSGDRGKRLPDGNIVVTGRLNTMVKINGNRVEPGEIEAALRRIPGIGNAAVRDFQGERQQVFLCAYYVAKNDPGEDAIREKLRQSLPHYMIPAFFMRLKNIPLNSSGKVDRFALPRPDANHRPYAAPETPREEAPDAWPGYSEILNRKLCDLHDSYRQKIEKKIMLPLEVRFVQPQTYALYRDLKVMGGASPNHIKPIHVISDERLKRFFFGLVQQ